MLKYHVGLMVLNFFWNNSKYIQKYYGIPFFFRYLEKTNLPNEFETKSGIKVTCIRPEYLKALLKDFKIYRFVPKILREDENGDKLKTPRKTLIYYHGGGMIFGQELAKGGFPIAVAKMLKDYQIFSIDYRLSPEYVFPIPINDCVEATRYLLNNKDKYQIGEFGCYGESAGGHLALSVNMTIDYMKEFGVKPRLISSIVPMTQCVNFKSSSFLDEKNQLESPSYQVKQCWQAFAGVDMYNEDFEFGKISGANYQDFDKIKMLLKRDDFCPGLASDQALMKLLNNTEVMSVSVADFDVLEDDGVGIVERLMEVKKLNNMGTVVKLERFKNCGHLFMHSSELSSKSTGYKEYNEGFEQMVNNTLRF